MPGSHRAYACFIFPVVPEMGHLWRQECWPKGSSFLLEAQLEEGSLGLSGHMVCWWDFVGGRGRRVLEMEAGPKLCHLGLAVGMEVLTIVSLERPRGRGQEVRC